MSTDTGTTGTTTTGTTGTADTTGTTGAAGGTTQTGMTTDTGTQTQTGATDTTGTTTGSTAADTTTADWRSSITDPDAVEFAKRVASPADAVKIALDLRKANSAMIKVPGKDASAEDRAKFNKAIGVPETVEGYKFDLGREPTEADKTIQNSIAKIALENGVPAEGLSAMSKEVHALATAMKAEENRVAVEARGAHEAALRKEWGADYDRNKALGARALQAFGEVSKHPEVIDFFDKTLVNGSKLGDHPIINRLFGNIGNRMGEGDFIGAVGSDQRQSLQSELNQIMHDNPPGTEKYKAPQVQARIKAINEALYGAEPAMRLG